MEKPNKQFWESEIVVATIAELRELAMGGHPHAQMVLPRVRDIADHRLCCMTCATTFAPDRKPAAVVVVREAHSPDGVLCGLCGECAALPEIALRAKVEKVVGNEIWPGSRTVHIHPAGHA